MEFLKLVILEIVFLTCASLIFFYGIRGLIATAIILSGVNYWVNFPNNFLKWELILILGIGIGLGVLYWTNKKARASNISIGLMGGFIGLVIFGAFVTPVLALILWMLTIGLGLIAGLKLKDLLWGVAPTIWRAVLALGIIIFGNILS